jgi:hypothetical protein
MWRTLRALSLLGLLALVPGTPPEPILFFGEDWEAAGPDFPSARAARDAFVAQLDLPGEEDFEGARGRVLDLPLGGYGARLTGRARDSVSTALVWTPGRHATSARRFYEHGSDLVLVELDRAAEGVGFYAIDVGDAGGELRVTVGGEGWERSFPVPHQVVPRDDGRGEGAVLFFGVVAPGLEIRRIELRNVGDPGDGFGYDDLIVGRLRRAVAQ